MKIKNKALRVVAVALFVAVELVLGILLQTVGGREADACRFSSVILCALFCLLFAERAPAYLLTQAALVCTVGADYFLVWSQPMVQLPAMLFFLVAQSAYAARLYWAEPAATRRRWQRWSVPVLGAVALAVTVIVLGQGVDALALVSMLYYTILVLNVVFAMGRYGANPLLAVGLLLFLFCDTAVGLSMMDAYLPIPPDALLYRVLRPGFDVAWACYLPSQVLITLSLAIKKQTTE